jgi:outer membrane protein OmpA-like peptidoglycan-associated protein
MKSFLSLLFVVMGSLLFGQEINLIDNPINGYTKENLGTNINTVYGEYMPIIAPDDQTLYILRVDDPNNYGGEDIWYAQRKPDGKWGSAQNIGKPLNNSSHNYIISIMPDNNLMYVANVYDSDGTFRSGGLSKTTKTLKGWSMPEEVVIDDFYNQSTGWQNFTFSSTRQVLIMSIQREDSQGGVDLYISFLKDDDTYTAPKNLGSILNTTDTECSPFLATDDRTLYFSSNGHPGFGSNDIFVTRRLDDSWTKWSKPENLGTEVNGPDWDGFYTIPASGENAYLVSRTDKNNHDIFQVKIAEAAKPQPVALIYGNVYDQKTGEPIAAEIVYSDLETNEVVGKASSSVIDGSYKIILPSGKQYSFLAEKEDFYSISENINLIDNEIYQEIERDLSLAPIEVSGTIRLNNIFFETGEHELQKTSFSELERLVSILRKSPNMQIEIHGHTDNVGAKSSNQALSERRAQAVRDFLISKNIDPDRLSIKGFGESRPIASNEGSAGRRENRRVEFSIIKK